MKTSNRRYLDKNKSNMFLSS